MRQREVKVRIMTIIFDNVVNFLLCLMQYYFYQGTINHKLQQKLHVTDDFVQRLGLEKELEGHSGCVNCLEWNETGR
jgi:WD and tetratricopeptide repeat-containing protein 1